MGKTQMPGLCVCAHMCVQAKDPEACGGGGARGVWGRRVERERHPDTWVPPVCASRMPGFPVRVFCARPPCCSQGASMDKCAIGTKPPIPPSLRSPRTQASEPSALLPSTPQLSIRPPPLPQPGENPGVWGLAWGGVLATVAPPLTLVVAAAAAARGSAPAQIPGTTLGLPLGQGCGACTARPTGARASSAPSCCTGEYETQASEPTSPRHLGIPATSPPQDHRRPSVPMPWEPRQPSPPSRNLGTQAQSGNPGVWVTLPSREPRYLSPQPPQHRRHPGIPMPGNSGIPASRPMNLGI